jgi:hypothetical protein
VNGWLPERLRNDLIWNRTVNMRGERDSNDEADLVNEFLNREFKGTFTYVLVILNMSPHPTFGHFINPVSLYTSLSKSRPHK